MGQNISFRSKAADFVDQKVVYLCDVKPSKVGFNKKLFPVKSLICDFVKNNPKDKRSGENQNANNLKPLDNSTNYPKYCPDQGYKGQGDYGFFTAIYECYNKHWALKTIPDDWWLSLIHI